MAVYPPGPPPDTFEGIHLPSFLPRRPSVLTPLLTSVVADNTNYNAFGWACTTPTGRIAITWRQGTSHTSEDGKVMFAYSDDGGATWTTTALYTPAASHDYRDPTIVCTATGRLVVSFFDSQQPSPQITYGHYTAYSDDNGATWTLSALMNPFSSWTASSGAILAHSSGVLIMPVYGQNSGDTQVRNGVMFSSDNGVTWGNLTYVTAQNSYCDEMTLAERPDRSIIAGIRNNVGSGGAYIQTAVSTDVGHTWSAPAWVSFGSYPARPALVSIPRTTSNPATLALFYRQTTTQAGVYRVSVDGGATWGAEQILSPSAPSSEYMGGIATGSGQMVLAFFYESGTGAVAQLGVYGLDGMVPGTTIGYNAYTPAADGVMGSTTSTTFVKVAAAGGQAQVQFVVPPSGVVEIEVAVSAQVSASLGFFGLIDNVSSAEVGTVLTANTLTTALLLKFVVTGLTPGSAHTYDLAFRVSNAANTIYVYGGPTYGAVVMTVRSMAPTRL